MILTITPDPIFESSYYVEDFQLKRKTKAENVIYNIKGKGMNASKILNNHNLDVFATGFLGGLKGQYIFNLLKSLKIYNDFIFIKDESRGQVMLIQEDEVLTIICEESPRISREELGEFYKLYASLLEKASLICGLGDLPLGIPQEIYFDLAQMAKNNNKKFILDAQARELVYGLEAIPFMVKMNKKDLEEIFNIELTFENEIINLGYSIIEKGVEILVIDLNEKGSIVLTKDQGYRLEIPNVNLENINKDKGYMLAGYSLGIDKQYDLETTMKLGQSMRIAYSIDENIDKTYMGDIKKIMTGIEISPINY